MEAFVTTNQSLGNMDSIEDQQFTIKEMTRTFGWKYFKVLTDEEYLYGSDFASCMCRKLGKNVELNTTRDWWNSSRPIIQKAMQDMRSTTTQAMKKVFFGTFIGFIPILFGIDI
jgi:hypothetical protein